MRSDSSRYSSICIIVFLQSLTFICTASVLLWQNICSTYIVSNQIDDFNIFSNICLLICLLHNMNDQLEIFRQQNWICPRIGTLFKNLYNIKTKMVLLNLWQSFPTYPSVDFSVHLRSAALWSSAHQSWLQLASLSDCFYTCTHPVIFSYSYFAQITMETYW